MTDNYHIDKNSKLFQKFINLKTNKNNQSVTLPEKSISNEGAEAKKIKYDHRQEAVRDMTGKRQRHNHYETSVSNQRAALHVTVDDIEQAASIAFDDEKQQPQQIKRQEQYQTRGQKQIKQIQQFLEKAPARWNQPEYYQEPQIKVQPAKPERIRERKGRDFQERKKNYFNQEDNRSEQPTSVNENSIERGRMTAQQLRTKHDSGIKQKQNLELNKNEEEMSLKLEEMTFSAGLKDSQYKKKYERLNQKYEQLKETTQKERKIKQKELHDKDSQFEVIKQKYFQLRSNEDTLTTENKRLKEKVQSQNMIRLRAEEEVKELQFKVQQLQDMLDGKDSNLKKKGDQVAYWKNQQQNYRGQVKALNSQIQKLEDRCQFLQSENKLVKKDITNKENLIEELRRNINSLIEENNIVKDQIYKLTIKLYHLEQQNQIIKGDMLRREKDQPREISLIQQHYKRNMESLSPKREERQSYPGRAERIQRYERPERESNQTNQGNRRRQFARERTQTTKPQRQDRSQIIERKAVAEPNQRKKEQNERKTEHNNNPSHNQSRDVTARIQYLQSELERRKNQKATNGAQRREKIQIERELQQLLTK